ncbi:MAG TPA: ABC transporter substrate-binding protein [Nitrobacter sp.]|nr:ABC transporter substrate-binding protein [Nitrobacter sp.]
MKTVADLRGKRVALNKGSNVHYLLVRSLEANGLNYSDIVPAYLAPADARAAFECGAIDAWVIWDPYYAAAEIGLGAREIVDGDRPCSEYLVLYRVTSHRRAQSGSAQSGARGVG